MVDIFKALSDGTRIRIVNLLLNGELCVCDIEDILGITQSNASRHLTKLKNSGIISHEKKAQWVFYKIHEDFRKEHQLLMEYIQQQTNEEEKYLQDTNKLKDYNRTCMT